MVNRAFVLFATLLCFEGCHSAKRYDVILRNATADSVRAQVQCDDFASIAWELAPHDAVNEKLAAKQVPDTAIVTWVDKSGIAHHVTVRVKAIAPSIRDGDGIIFVINSNGTVSTRFQVWRGLKAVEIGT